MALINKVLTGTALIAALSLGVSQSADASPLPHQLDGSLISQTTSTDEGLTRVPARVLRVFGNDYAQVELLPSGETRPVEFRFLSDALGDTRRIVPGSYLILTLDNNDVVSGEIATEDEVNALIAENESVESTTSTTSTTTVETETRVEREEVVQQQPAPAPAPAPAQPQPQPAPRALW